MFGNKEPMRNIKMPPKMMFVAPGFRILRTGESLQQRLITENMNKTGGSVRASSNDLKKPPANPKNKSPVPHIP
jgi:hypothetical protein